MFLDLLREISHNIWIKLHEFLKINGQSEVSVAQLVRFFMVEPAHPDLSIRLNSYYLVVGDVFIDNEISVVTSLILRYVSLVFRRSSMYVYIYRGECMPVINVCVFTVFLKRTNGERYQCLTYNKSTTRQVIWNTIVAQCCRLTAWNGPTVLRGWERLVLHKSPWMIS